MRYDEFIKGFEQIQLPHEPKFKPKYFALNLRSYIPLTLHTFITTGMSLLKISITL